MTILAVSVVLSAVIILATVYIKWKHSYWQRKNVPQLSPSFRGEIMGGWIRKLPHYVPIQPEIIKNIMQKDFQYFMDRGLYYNEKDDPLSAHLVNIGGQRWKNLRSILTPTFTSGKLKMMFQTMLECANPMKAAVSSYCINKQSIDIKDVSTRFIIDVIGSCAFGLDCNSFKSENTAFITHGRKIIAPSYKVSEQLKQLLALFKPNWARRFGIPALFPRESSTFFFNLIKDTVKYRNENKVHRKDMLQIVMDLEQKEGISNENSLTMEEIAANALIFFLAGFETSSTTIQFCLFELANNIDIQEKVRDEINRVLLKHDGKITHDAITDMKYMAQVIDETLRKYPPVCFVPRQCLKDYVEPISGITIETGTMVVVPIWGLHMDSQYFPNPEKFDPERFSKENKRDITPYTYIPFGEGPRICIGMKFGMMQLKVGLTTLLSNYSFTVSPKTRIPLEWHGSTIALTTTNPIWLNIEKVS